jgi:hypothetical protein
MWVYLPAMGTESEKTSNASKDTSIAQEVRKGGVAHNTVISGGIPVLGTDGNLTVQPVAPAATSNHSQQSRHQSASTGHVQPSVETPKE